MSGGAGAVAPGAPNLPATMDNFDAIVGSYDNQPEPAAPPPAASKAKLSDVAPLGDEGAPEIDDGLEAEGIEGDEVAEPELETTEPGLEELAAKYQDLTDRPDLPEEFYSKKGIATVNGEQYEVTVKEAFDAYQRRAVTTQAQQEARAIEQHYKQLIGGHRQMTQSWLQDPNKLEADLEDMDLGPHLDHIVKQRYRKFYQEQTILDRIQDPQEKAYARQRFESERMHAMQVRAQKREAEKQRALAEQNQGQTQEQQQYQAIQRSMAQHRPKAFREVGLKETPYTRKLIGQETQALHRIGTPLTYDIVLEAAKNAKDIWDAEIEAAAMKDAEKRVRSRAIPPKRGPAGSTSVKRPKGPSSTQQARVSEFDDVMKTWDGGR